MDLRHPEVLWAQRCDKVYLTIALPDAKNVSIKCEPEGLFSFSALGLKGESFDFSLKLYGNIVPEGCKSKVGLRNILCSVQKEKKGWWKRLLMSEEKPAPYLKVDWNKWCDEDEESENYGHWQSLHYCFALHRPRIRGFPNFFKHETAIILSNYCILCLGGKIQSFCFQLWFLSLTRLSVLQLMWSLTKMLSHITRTMVRTAMMMMECFIFQI